MMDKTEFVRKMQVRTKLFTVEVIRFCEQLPQRGPKGNITRQLLNSSSSVGANYRAACRARSKAEFFSKLSICVEEADETVFWLEVIEDVPIECEKSALNKLKSEAIELLKILSTARKNTNR